MMKLDKELSVALKATELANKVIMDLYNKDYKTEIKEDDSPVTEADLKANEIIIKTLKEEFNDYGILSEEINDSLERLNKEFVG